MAIFGPKPRVNPFGKKVNFSTLKLIVYINQKGVFSFQNIVKDIFLAYITYKKALEKWPFLDQNQGFTPLEQSQFFDFKSSCFYSLERCFFVLVYRKRHFPGLYCLKKKIGKMVIFGSKAWVNPFKKKWPFFDFLNFLFLQPRMAFLSFQNIVKDIFLAYIALKKKLEKW